MPLRLVRLGEGGGRVLARFECSHPRQQPIDRGVDLLDVEQRAGGIHGRGSLADAPGSEDTSSGYARTACRERRTDGWRS